MIYAQAKYEDKRNAPFTLYLVVVETIKFIMKYLFCCFSQLSG